ncbi:MAG: cupin domain-containing protein [Candidatus Poseidoniales archaeon]|nr:MAG: cupin domain-containing protein [Candidatus Poseidoniales archaeon]
MVMEKINLKNKFSDLLEYWSPRVISEMNDYQIKIVKIKGDFIWHNHENTDELFYVIEGKMNIHFHDSTVVLENGDLFVVPRGVDHMPSAETECHVMLIEPKGTKNTGNRDTDLTAENDIWI